MGIRFYLPLLASLIRIILRREALLQLPHPRLQVIHMRYAYPNLWDLCMSKCLYAPLFVEPINFLSLLHPSSSPPYHVFVARIIKSSDQQASIFLQQKLKVAEIDERAKIVDAICANGFEMMAHR
jgi:hypothetical protein